MQIHNPSRLVLFSLIAILLVSCSSGGSSNPALGLVVASGLKFSPGSGATNTLVTIEGTGFGQKPEENEVRFGGALATVLLASSNAVLAYVPGDAQTGPITVKSPSGLQSSPLDFLVSPNITKLFPDRGSFGQEILIEGTGFDTDPQGNAVLFGGGVPAVVTSSTSSSVGVLVPFGAQTGEILLTTNGGTAQSFAPFFILLEPVVSGFSPASGKLGATVTIQGENFGPSVADNAVQFGAVQAAISSASTTAIVCTLPDGALTNAISVTTVGGTGTSGQPFLVVPEIFTLSTPVSAAGASLTITGKAFDLDPAKNSVGFGGGALGTVQAASYQSITVLIPPGAISGPVSVVTPGGTAVSSSVLTILSGPPSITAFSPASGFVGNPVTISGQNFSPILSGNDVLFSGVSASLVSASATQIVATVPSGATTGPITVTTPGGSDVTDSSFTVNQVINLRYAYAANAADGTISAYTMEDSFGLLRHHGYALSGTGPGAGTKALLVHPSAPLLFAANSGDNTVSLFQVEENGRLTKVDQEAAGGSPAALAWNGNGTRAYVVNETGASVSTFTVDVGAKTLTALGSPVTTGAQPRGIVVTPNGQFAYVVNNAPSSNVSAFSINAGGQLVPLGTFSAGSGPSAVAVDPNGTALYVSNAAGNSLSSFTILPGGTLQSAGTIDLGAGAEPAHVAVDPFNRFVFTANKGSDSLSLFVVVAPANLVGPIPLPAKDGPSAVVPDPMGRFVYATHSLSNEVTVLGLDSGGKIYSLAITSRGGPSSFAIFTQGTELQEESKYLLGVSQAGDSASSYSILPGTGQLTPRDTKIVGNDPTFVVADPFGRFAFVANSASTDAGAVLGNSVSVLGINADAGSLTVSQTFKMSPLNGMYSVAVDPSGRFLAVPHLSDDKISIFTIDQSSGNLSGQQSFSTGDFPRHAAFDASGRFLYVVNQASDNVSMFQVNGWTGALTPQGTVSISGLNAAPNQAVADPRGKFLFVSDQGNFGFEKGVTSFTIDGVTGVLGNPQKKLHSIFESSGVHDSLAVDPYGSFLFWGGVSIGGPGNLGSYSVNSSSGVLTDVVGSPFFSSSASSVRSIVLDRKGSLLFSANIGTTNALQSHSLSLGVPAPATPGAPSLSNPFSVAVVNFVK